jgi:hypothetical protein
MGLVFLQIFLGATSYHLEQNLIKKIDDFGNPNAIFNSGLFFKLLTTNERKLKYHHSIPPLNKLKIDLLKKMIDEEFDRFGSEQLLTHDTYLSYKKELSDKKNILDSNYKQSIRSSDHKVIILVC